MKSTQSNGTKQQRHFLQRRKEDKEMNILLSDEDTDLYTD